MNAVGNHDVITYSRMVTVLLISKCLKVASDGVLSEKYGHDGSGVYLGDGQTEAEKWMWWIHRHKVDAA